MISCPITMVAMLVFQPVSSPPIHLSFPSDARPLTILPETPDSKILESNQKAVLWWTVFKEMANKGYINSAQDAADRAVKAVYGNTNGEDKN